MTILVGSGHVDRHDNASGFQAACVAQGRFRAIQKVHCDPIARLRSGRKNIRSDVVGEAVKL